MARSLRIERTNGVYHVINRGNYRQDLFINEGAHKSFEKCLFEACEKCNWILEGFCVMTNHFHLIVRTPEGNLIYGMFRGLLADKTGFKEDRINGYNRRLPTAITSFGRCMANCFRGAIKV